MLSTHSTSAFALTSFLYKSDNDRVNGSIRCQGAPSCALGIIAVRGCYTNAWVVDQLSLTHAIKHMHPARGSHRMEGGKEGGSRRRGIYIYALLYLLPPCKKNRMSSYWICPPLWTSPPAAAAAASQECNHTSYSRLLLLCALQYTFSVVIICSSIDMFPVSKVTSHKFSIVIVIGKPKIY